jgi:integrase
MKRNPAKSIPVVKAGEARPRPAPDRVYAEARIAATPREMLMLRLAAEMGLRRAEVAQVHSRDLMEDLVGYSLLVHGKGGKERLVPVPPALASDIANAGGYVFPGDDHGHLSPAYVGKLIARIMPDAWTMHTLRHRFATMAYGVDRDVFAVQELLGHASPATTRRYVKIQNDALRRTVLAVAS